MPVLNLFNHTSDNTQGVGQVRNGGRGTCAKHSTYQVFSLQSAMQQMRASLCTQSFTPRAVHVLGNKSILLLTHNRVCDWGKPALRGPSGFQPTRTYLGAIASSASRLKIWVSRPQIVWSEAWKEKKEAYSRQPAESYRRVGCTGTCSWRSTNRCAFPAPST